MSREKLYALRFTEPLVRLRKRLLILVELIIIVNRQESPHFRISDSMTSQKPLP